MNPSSQNFYERLGLTVSATEKEVEKAFYKAIRVYQPERNPEDYKLIREAYETLSNEQSRKEYDNRSQYGPEIQNIEAKLETAKEDEDYDEQIRLYKRLVTLLPQNATIRNKLGLAYLGNDQHPEALIQFDKAHQLDLRNPLYLQNMAYIYKKQEKYGNAVECYNQAWELDINDYESPRELASMYFYEMSLPAKAFEVLQKAIYTDGKLDFQDFFCIFDLVKYYCLDKNETELRKHLLLIEKISLQDDEKDYSSSRLREFATLLASRGIMDVSAEFTQTAYRLHPSEDNEFSNDFISQMNQVAQSTTYCKNFKLMIRQIGEIYYDGMENDEKDEFFEALAGVMSCEPDNRNIKNNIKAMKRNEPVIYETNASFFEKLLNFTPSKYLNDCPYCSKLVSVSLYAYDTYICPHCNRNIYYTSSGYSKSQYSNPSSSNKSSTQPAPTAEEGSYFWVLCVIVVIVLIMVGQCS